MGPGVWASQKAGDAEAIMTRAFSARDAGRIDFECVGAVLPFNIGFSTMATARRAYSSGLPIRFGNAASLVSVSVIASGILAVAPVAKRLGAMATTLMPIEPRSRAIVNVMAAMPPLAAV